LDTRALVCIRGFLPGRTQRVGGQSSEEVRVTSGLLQGSVLGPLMFLVNGNNIWKIIESTIRLFADVSIIYRKILSNNNIENVQIDPNRLGEWPFENEIAIISANSKATCFTKARATESLNYSLGDTVISKANSCK
jgi:hypothetical protein